MRRLAGTLIITYATPLYCTATSQSGNIGGIITAASSILVAVISGFFMFLSRKSNSNNKILIDKLDGFEVRLCKIEDSFQGVADFKNELDYVETSMADLIRTTAPKFVDYLRYKCSSYDEFCTEIDRKIAGADASGRLDAAILIGQSIAMTCYRRGEELLGKEFIDEFYREHSPNVEAFINKIRIISDTSTNRQEDFRREALRFKRSWIIELVGLHFKK